MVLLFCVNGKNSPQTVWNYAATDLGQEQECNTTCDSSRWFLCNRVPFFSNEIAINILFFPMSPFQKQCIEFCLNAKPVDRFMPENKSSFKYKVWKLVVSSAFEYFIMTLITLNTIALMLKVSTTFIFTDTCT